MIALLAWPAVTLVLGLLLLALLWDFLQAWLRGLRSEREWLAKSISALELRIMTCEKAWPLLDEHHEKLKVDQVELADQLKKLDARVLDERELRARR